MILAEPFLALAQNHKNSKAKAQIRKDPKLGTHSVVMTQKISSNIDTIYNILIDYESYPEYMPHTESTKILKSENSSKWVKYKLVFLIWFEVEYVLKIDHKKNDDYAKISWVFDSGDYFDEISGYWELVAKQDLTTPSNSASENKYVDVKYVSKIGTKVTIPRAILNLITKQSVYDLFEALEKRIKKQANKPVIHTVSEKAIPTYESDSKQKNKKAKNLARPIKPLK